MVSSDSRTDSPRPDVPAVGSVDPYALFEALTGRKIDRRSVASGSSDDYYDVNDMKRELQALDEKMPKPDDKPQDLHIGAINPYALVENMLGRQLDTHSVKSAQIMADVLQTDYDELFDLQHQSVLFAGLQLNDKERRAEELSEKDVRILQERDLISPDLSQIERLEDIKKIGLKDVDNMHVKRAHLENGKLHVVLHAHSIGKTVSNKSVTMSINDLATPYRRNKEGKWSPPNTSWQDVYEVFYRRVARRMITEDRDFRLGEHEGRRGHGHMHHTRKFDDPMQGATSNSWLIAAIFSVFWADPAIINRGTRVAGRMRRDEEGQRGSSQKLTIKFHDKGGRNNNKTQEVEVDFEIPVNNSTNEPVYCQSSDGLEVWPSLYEKAFAKWITGNESNKPDITATHHGDPIKAMAQINGREPQYYFTEKHSATELVGIVRNCSVNRKTINPMACFTYATDRMYRGSNLVANHAYSILGWSSQGQRDRQYIIVRNPFGVTEPLGLNSYPGVIDYVHSEYWRPASLLDPDGVLAIEVSAFKHYFRCIGVAR